MKSMPSGYYVGELTGKENRILKTAVKKAVNSIFKRIKNRKERTILLNTVSNQCSYLTWMSAVDASFLETNVKNKRATLK